MIWTPTEGQKRADTLMLELRALADACGIDTATVIFPMYHARVFDLISKTLDQALADGAEGWINPVLGKVVGSNGIREPQTIWPGDGKAGQILTPDGWRDAAATNGHAADPVVEAHEEGPSAYAKDTPEEVQAAANEIAKFMPSETDAPKKKRGRPKGSKAKKAKPAKGKAAKPAVVEDAMGAADFIVAPAEPTEVVAEGAAQ